MKKEEALEIIRKNMPSDKSLPVYEAIQTLIPELAESEDERIRKEIIHYILYKADGVSEEQEHSWIAYLEKQEKQKTIAMEVYEVGKGTTICGQDYRCKKDYKEGNCWYIKNVIYHCSRDGYLNDQNGISWSCTPKWFSEYIYTNSEWSDKEKNDFVSGQFLQCKLSFDEFKEGEHYWLEYVGDDIYVGRSDNILNQKFHITPRQLYTLFSKKLEEVQGPPQEEKQVLLNYEPPFDENPSDKEIIEALIHHLNEQDGFLTAINCVSTKAILSWLKKQKEQKPEPVFKVGDKIRLKSEPKYPYREIVDIKNGAYYFDEAVYLPFDNQDKWEKEQKSMEKQNYSDLTELERAIYRGFLCAGVENVPVGIIKETAQECLTNIKPAWSEEDEKNLNLCIEFVESCEIDYDAKPHYSTWLKSLPERFNLEPKPEWSEEDEKQIRQIERIVKDAGCSVKLQEQIHNWLKSLKSSWKPTDEQIKAIRLARSFVVDDFSEKPTLSETLKELEEQLKKLM